MPKRNLLVALSVVALLSVSGGQSKAVAPPPAPAATVGIGAGVVGGVVGVGLALIVYDLWLKANGYKNWDGTPKVVKPARKPRR